MLGRMKIVVLCVCFQLQVGLLEAKSIDEMMVDALVAAGKTVHTSVNKDAGIQGAPKTPELVELDMKLSDELAHRYRSKRAQLNWQDYLWPDKTIPYELADSISEKNSDLIREAMDTIQRYTCMRFRQKQPSDIDYVYIKDDIAGCWSYVARYGGKQELNLQPGIPGCMFHEIIVHELFHAMGIFHEQSRTDRNNYLNILWNNIWPGMEHNFYFYDASVLNSHGVPYDHYSNMHYGKTAFGIGGATTIQTKNPHYQDIIGNARTLSFRDAAGANVMYECAAHCGEPVYGSNSEGEYYLDQNCDKMCSYQEGTNIIPCDDLDDCLEDPNDPDCKGNPFAPENTKTVTGEGGGQASSAESNDR